MTDFFRKNIVIGSVEVLGRIPLVFTVGWLARSVGPQAYGSWSLVLVFQNIVAAIAGLGLASSISRLASVAEPQRAQGMLALALRAAALALCLLAGITWLGRDLVREALGLPPAYTQLLAAGLLLAAVSVVEGLLDAFFKAREQIGRQVVFVGIRTSAEVAAVAAIFWYHLVGVPPAPRWLLAYALLSVTIRLAGYLALSLYGAARAELPPADERQRFLRYGLPLIPSTITAWFVGQGDRLVLGHVVGKAELGQYAFAASLAAYLVFLGYAVYPLLLPRASRLYEAGDQQGLGDLFATCQAVFLVLLAVALCVLALFAGDIVRLTAGPQFLPAGWMLVVLAVSVGLEQLFGVYQWVFHLCKRPVWILWLQILYAGLLLGAVAVAGRLAGIVAVPWAVLGATLLFNGGRYFLAVRLLPLRVERELLLAAAGAVVFSGGLAIGSLSWSLAARLAVLTASLPFAVVLVGLPLRHRWSVLRNAG